jgi:hypothetical protein
MAENVLSPEELEAFKAQLAEDDVAFSAQGTLSLQQTLSEEDERREALANPDLRTNYQRGFEEQGLTNRVPGPIRAIDRALHGTRNIPFLPSADAANRLMSQTLDSAVLDYLPAGPKNWLAERGIGSPAGVDAEGVAGAAGRGIGMAAPYVVAPLYAGEKFAFETALNLTPRMNINPLRATLEEMYKTYLKNPANELNNRYRLTYFLSLTQEPQFVQRVKCRLVQEVRNSESCSSNCLKECLKA